MRAVIEFDHGVNKFEIEEWLIELNKKPHIKNAYFEDCNNCKSPCKYE